MEEKSIYFKIPKSGREGFVVQLDNLPYFYDRLHYHPELQLKYIVKGTGDLFVSDTIKSFESGNLFLIGSNQSHVFKSDKKYFEENSNLISRSISVFFHERSLGDGFFNIEEMSAIRDLIQRSGRGIQFSPNISYKVGPEIQNLLKVSGFERLLKTLFILNELALSDDFKFLATMKSSEPLSDKENEKVNDVINYIFSHYKKDLKLKDVARIANYSQAAFCMFFKRRTRKTFTEFLNEVRISKACKMLKDSDLNISEICFESGFNNVSNFNRQFKKVTNFSPSNYRKKYNTFLFHADEINHS